MRVREKTFELGQNWGWLTCEGIAAVVFGIWAGLVTPPTVSGVAMLLGLYLLVDGVCLWGASRYGLSAHVLPYLTGAGIVTILAGICILASTPVVLLWSLVTWAGVSGLLKIVAANRIGIGSMANLVVAGLLAMVLGVAVAIHAPLGPTLGVYGFVYGVTLMGLSDSLYRLVDAPHDRQDPQPELIDDAVPASRVTSGPA
jgi:uncharacterized membrane protein HdeD (DUF308 family)